MSEHQNRASIPGDQSECKNVRFDLRTSTLSERDKMKLSKPKPESKVKMAWLGDGMYRKQGIKKEGSQTQRVSPRPQLSPERTVKAGKQSEVKPSGRNSVAAKAKLNKSMHAGENS